MRHLSLSLSDLQGDQASEFYIVEQGTARILKEDPVCVYRCTRISYNQFTMSHMADNVPYVIIVY